MGKSRDSLHLDRVSLVERMIQNTWRVNNLPSGVLVVSVTDEQVLGCESIRLHINISIRDIIDEAGLSDIWETSHNQSSRVCIN